MKRIEEKQGREGEKRERDTENDKEKRIGRKRK